MNYAAWTPDGNEIVASYDIDEQFPEPENSVKELYAYDPTAAAYTASPTPKAQSSESTPARPRQHPKPKAAARLANRVTDRPVPRAESGAGQLSVRGQQTCRSKPGQVPAKQACRRSPAH
jgi:hypothetical protein